MEEKEKSSTTVKRIRSVISFLKRIGALITRLNQHMDGKFSAPFIAQLTAAGVALLAVFMLFGPRVLGVADDGSFSHIMNTVGLSYLPREAEQASHHEYFVRVYSTVTPYEQDIEHSTGSQIPLIKAAVFLDNLVTRDRFFDIRFLALIYLILYIPGVYLVVEQICYRARNFSEMTVLGLLGLIIFGDVGYLTYFNSFYPEAVWMISLLYIAGIIMAFQQKRRMLWDVGWFALYIAASALLITSRGECAFLGIFLIIFCIRLIFMHKDWKWGMICILAGIFISAVSLHAAVTMENNYDQIDKFHAMTRGVLFVSDDPGETLREFDMPANFELLADTSLYNSLPITYISDPIIQNDFLPAYSTGQITFYYLRHPGRFLRMEDQAIRAGFSIRRDYCGNYERNAGMRPQARSIFWCTWSTYKDNSAPKTIGFLIVVLAVACVLYGRGYTLRPLEERRDTVLLDFQVLFFVLCIAQAANVIIHSGDAELVQHCFLIGLAMDLMTYGVFAELLHRLRIF